MTYRSIPTGKLARTAIFLLAASVTLALGLAVLELMFGTWLSGNPWVRARALNIVIDRTVVYDARGLYRNGGDVVYSRDRYGLRGQYGDPGDVTILTLGGSTTDQRYIGDGFTWQDELERRLQAAGKPATVANAGVDGHSTFGFLAAYEYWFPLIPNLRPTYTVLYLGVNDFFRDAPLAAFEGTADGAKTLISRIKADSASYRLYRRLRGLVLAQRAGLQHSPTNLGNLEYTEHPLLREHEALRRDSVQAFEQRVRKLLQRVRAHGSIPVCVLEPSLYYRQGIDGRVIGVAEPMEVAGIPGGVINGVDYFLLRRGRDAVVRASCDAIGAPTIDLVTKEWETEDFYDLMHMTPVGAKKVGKLIAASMEALPF